MSQPHEQAMIERWAELDQKATEGPWSVHKSEGACYYKGKRADGFNVSGPTYIEDYENPMLCEQDAELIAFLRNHSAKLRRVVEAAKKVCSNYLTGLPDDDPRKGAGNYLADALEELER